MPDAEAAELAALAGVQADSPALPEDAAGLVHRLQIPAPDRAELLAARPDPDSDPALWWLFTHCQAMLRARMGETGDLPAWPRLPERGRYLYPWVFLATVPDVRAYHRKHGVDDAISWGSLAALGAQMGNNRLRYGEGGLQGHNWVTFHFRGVVYALGRLHFERSVTDFDAAGGPRRGEPALGVHIPEGRLTPESCDAAIERAGLFFARCFPDEPYRFATCSSWVLDPQLREYLDPHSNIIRFLDRFTLVPDDGENDDEMVVDFIFKRPFAQLERLPQDTTLQRAIVQHIRAGRHWRFRTGWFAL